MRFVDRLLTIVVTATLTSAFWIVAGGTLMDKAAGGKSGATPVSSSPQSSPVAVPEAAPVASQAPALDTADVSAAPPGDLIIPVANVRADQLTDTFTDSRSGGARLHEAIDIMAARGTPIMAAAPGKVEKLFQSNAGGNTIYVRSNDGKTIYYYAHLDSYAPGLKEGMAVTRGQNLGAVGSTGNASPDAPHLHFAIMQTTPDSAWWEPSHAIDPYPVLGGK